MRIISGKYSGRVLSGKIPEGTRPTTDMAREALFNSLQHLIDFEGISVLDLYAGTGAVGIEALSLGAENAVFVEFGFKQLNLIRENLKNLNITDTSAKVHKRKVLDYLKSLTNGEQFDFIFADPPYVLIEYNEILEYIYENNLLKEDGIIVFEMENSKLPVIHKMFELIKEKHYGMTKFYFIKKIN